MNRSQARTRLERWEQAIALLGLAIALLAFGASSRVNAEEAQIDVELFAIAGGSEHAALTAGTGDALYAVAIRIQSAPDGLNMADVAEDAEAQLSASFASFEALHQAAENVFTTFFSEHEELSDIADALLPAFLGQASTSVSVRTDPKTGRRIFAE